MEDLLRKREVEVEEQRERDRKIDKEIGKERHTDYGIKELNSQHTGHIISENSKTSFFILLLALNYNYVLPRLMFLEIKRFHKLKYFCLIL